MTATAKTLIDTWSLLSSRIQDSVDRILFDEAIQCAQVGALRASFICVWLSCAESLKRKFHLASPYDGVATKVAAEIAKTEASHHSVDLYILTESKAYGFITDPEFTQLKSIYDQRCIYGHPYEQAPLEAQLVAAASIAVEFVLSRPPLLHHGYLDRQVDLLCGNPNFLDDHYPAVQAHAQIVHSRSDNAVHNWFLNKLWTKTAVFADDLSMAMFARRSSWFTQAFLEYGIPAGFLSSWDAAQAATRFPFIAWPLCSLRLFPLIGLHAQDVVVSTLLSYSATNAANLKPLSSLHEGRILNGRQSERFLSAVRALPPKVAAEVGISPVYFVEAIIEKLQSYHWYTQNPAVDAIISIGPCGISSLPADTQEQIGRNILQAADGDAASARSFMVTVAKADVQWSRSFIEGILFECLINERNEIRFKTKYLKEALLATRSLAPNDRVEIVTALAARLSTAKPKYGWICQSDKDATVVVIDETASSESFLTDLLAPLKAAIESIEVSL